MSLRKVRSGEPLVLPAMTWNAFIDAAADFQQRQRDQGRWQMQSFRQACIIPVKNNTGADAAALTVVGLDAPIFGPADNLDEFRSRLAMKAVAPSSSHKGRFAVLLEPIAAGGIGLAWAAGVCPARVNISDAKHACADIDNSGALASCALGSAQILWKAGDTGSAVWCVIRFGVQTWGTHDSPLVLDGTGETADTRTWDVAAPPAGTDGVQYQPARLYWSGTAGEPVKLFIRQPTFDSTGRLVLVSAEEEQTLATGNCETA